MIIQWVVVSGIFKMETDKAILVEASDGSEVWLPKSQINDWDSGTAEPEDLIEIEIQEWLANTHKELLS